VGMGRSTFSTELTQSFTGNRIEFSGVSVKDFPRGKKIVPLGGAQKEFLGKSEVAERDSPS